MSCHRNCPYQPHEGSLPDKVLGWLEVNGGRLTAAQIAGQFNRNSTDVIGLLARAVERNALRKGRDGRKVWYELPAGGRG